MPYQEIEDAKKEIQWLKNSLDYYKNPERKKRQVDMINVFINLINASERLADRDVNHEVLDIFALNRFFYMRKHYRSQEQTGETVDKFIIDDLNLNLELGREQAISKVAMDLAFDHYADSDEFNDEDKREHVAKNPRVLKKMAKAVDFYKLELENQCIRWRKSVQVWS